MTDSVFPEAIYEQAARAIHETDCGCGRDEPRLTELYGNQARAALGTVEPIVQSLIDALAAVQRFAEHAEERNITVPLWAGMLWDEAIGKVNDALAAVSTENPE